MNSYRMFTNYINGLSDNFEIPQSLINEVLKMPDVYYINKQGLRINASTLALVPGQLFMYRLRVQMVESKYLVVQRNVLNSYTSRPNLNL